MMAAQPRPGRASAERVDVEEATLIFLHIAKTGGQTFNAILRRQYPEDRIFSVIGQDVEDRIRVYMEWPEARRAAIRLIMGHVHFGIHEHIPGPSTYVTLLRDPVERALSTYYYVRRKPDHPAHREIVEREMDLGRVVRSGLLPMLDNGQTRILYGLGHWDVPYGECGEELLEGAKRNVERHFALVGTTERFDATLRLLERRFGWSRSFYRRRNVSKRRPGRDDVSPEALEAARRHNRLDLELYQWVDRRLEEAIRRAGGGFALRSAALERANRVWNSLRSVKARLEA